MVTRYSTLMPDGRTLVFVPGEPAKYKLDDEEVTEKEAAAAWGEQGADWQRGRTMAQALRFWQGR